MAEIKKLTDKHIENDKYNSPFLLAASFQGLISFNGSYSQNGVLYWEFAPKNKAESLINQLHTKREPHIPAKDLFEAINLFWREVSQTKS